jgi:hypothetical protein
MSDVPGHGRTEAKYEKTDIDARKVAVWGLVLVAIVCAIGIAGSFLVFRYLERKTESDVAPPSELYRLQQPPPEPRLLPQPWRNMEELRVASEKHLNSYGWADRPNGVVRVPIDRAIGLLAERGLPVRRDGLSAAPPAPAGATPKGMSGEKK